MKPGIGFPLLAVPDAGRLRFVDLEASVQEALRVILLTQPGELAWRPDFGAGLESLLHEPNIPVTHAAMEDRVRDALRRWEPRVDVLEVEVAEAPDDPARAHVTIVYRIRALGAVRRLGFTAEFGG